MGFSWFLMPLDRLLQNRRPTGSQLQKVQNDEKPTAVLSLGKSVALPIPWLIDQDCNTVRVHQKLRHVADEIIDEHVGPLLTLPGFASRYYLIVWNLVTTQPFSGPCRSSLAPSCGDYHDPVCPGARSRAHASPLRGRAYSAHILDFPALAQSPARCRCSQSAVANR